MVLEGGNLRIKDVSIILSPPAIFWRSCLHDHVGSFKARTEFKQTISVPPSCKRTCRLRGHQIQSVMQLRNLTYTTQVRCFKSLIFFNEVFFRSRLAKKLSISKNSISSRNFKKQIYIKVIEFFWGIFKQKVHKNEEKNNTREINCCFVLNTTMILTP